MRVLPAAGAQKAAEMELLATLSELAADVGILEGIIEGAFPGIFCSAGGADVLRGKAIREETRANGEGYSRDVGGASE